MNVRELIDLLSDEIDPESIVTLFDDVGAADCHVEQIVVEQFTVRLVPGEYVTEEDLT